MKSVVISSAKWAAILSLSVAALSACSGGTSKPASQPPAAQAPVANPVPATAPAAAAAVEAYKLITTEMDKAQDGKPDYALVSKTYNEKIKPVAQKRDSENGETTDQFITAAIDGAKDGKMNGIVAKQLVDKLIQKVLYTSMKASFKDVATNWSKPEDAKKALAEAKAFYKPVLETTVGKRDAALKTTMADAVNGAFGDMEKSIGGQSTLPFELAKQVADKMLMKAFYLAIAAKDAGYAYKVEKGAAEGKDVKVEQAEGWAFYQSINKYVAGQAKEDAEFVGKQFDLGTDPKAVNAEAVNGALIRGMAKVALDEYAQSQGSWGTDKAAITGLEGALFIDMLSFDITRLQGESAYKSLLEQAQKYNTFVKENKKDEAAAVWKQLETGLNGLIAKTPAAK